MLGFIAGELLVGDPALHNSVVNVDNALGVTEHQLGMITGAIGAAVVLIIGKVLLSRRQALTQS